MRSIDDTEQPWSKPLGKPIDADGQKLNIIPALDLAYLIFGMGRELCHFFVKRGEPLPTNLVKLTFGNNVPALPVIPPVDGDKDAPAVKASHGLCRTVRLAWQVKPQHIHGRTKLLNGYVGFLANDRIATVSRHYKIRSHFQ